MPGRRHRMMGARAGPIPWGAGREFGPGWLALARILAAVALQEGGHGYRLLETLGREQAGGCFGCPGGRPGLAGPTLYRRLRALESLGLVASSWQTSASGPARRVYRLTPAGWEAVAYWAEAVRRLREDLDGLVRQLEEALARGAATHGRPDDPGRAGGEGGGG